MLGMKGLEYIKKTREYLDYLEVHLKNIEKAFKEFTEKCSELDVIYDDFKFTSLRDAVINHDLSKFSTAEFVQYRQRFYQVKGEDVNEKVLELAWASHYLDNSHHPEYWKFVEPLNIDLAHFVIDLMSMSYVFGGKPYEYYKRNLPRWKIDSDSREYLETIFRCLGKG